MTRGRSAQAAFATQLEALSNAELSIMRSMEIVPESQLLTAILRGFRTWPSQESSSGAYLSRVFQDIADHVRVAVGAEMTAMGVGRYPHHPFSPWVVSGVSEELRKTLGVPRPVGLLGAVAIQGKKIRVRDIRTHPDAKGLPPGHAEITSFMGLPIGYGSVSLGTLYVANKIGAEEFSLEDERIAEMLTLVAGVAIQHAYLQGVLDTHGSRVQALVDSVPSGMLFIDKSRGAITANEAAMELFQKPMTEVYGQGHYRHMLLAPSGEEVASSEHPSDKSFSGQTVLKQEMLVRRDDDTTIPVRVNAAPVFGPYREIIGAVMVFENISLEKRIEQLRQQAASMIVHDIKSPLQAVLMGAQAIHRETKNDQATAAKAKVIEQSGRRLEILANRLLEAARIETAQITLKLKPVRLGAFIEGIIARSSAAYPARSIQFRAPSEKLRVNLDPDRMDEVISNLVDNAIKYSPSDKPVEVSAIDGPNGVEIRVRDHGVGIDAAAVERLFEPYARGANGKTLNQAGLGLGLYIVKGIVEAHGGAVLVESDPGKGSTFRIQLPSSLIVAQSS